MTTNRARALCRFREVQSSIVRKLSAISVVVCAVLCCVTTILWIAAWHFPRVLEWNDWHWQGTSLAIDSRSIHFVGGSVLVGRYRRLVPPSNAVEMAKFYESQIGRFRWFADDSPHPGRFPPADFYVAGVYISTRKVAGWKGVAVPLWIPAMLLAVPPLVALGRRRWWAIIERSRQGRCPTCGYDLRATVGRCPECGLDPKPAAALVPLWFRMSWAAMRAKTTTCFWWMAFYLTLGLTCESLLLAYGGERELVGVLGLLVVLPVGIGAFHAARFSRSREAFLCYGCLGGLYLFPALLLLPFQSRLLTTGWMFVLDVTGCIMSILAVGFIARYVAILRWRALDRRSQIAVLPVLAADEYGHANAAIDAARK
jgi:hypothetical protein